ncbi:Putative peroxiredoxin bcp [bacterium HR39]|nr:Putative peroxiredoxin bcp [bacterium HR39]
MSGAQETALREGEPLPQIELRLDDGTVLRTDDLRGRRWVLYVYPKDDTPGCTTEAVEFTRLLPEFHALGLEVVGISPDSADSHCRFREKQWS